MGIQTDMTNRAYRAQETFRRATQPSPPRRSAYTSSISPIASDPTLRERSPQRSRSIRADTICVNAGAKYSAAIGTAAPMSANRAAALAMLMGGAPPIRDRQPDVPPIDALIRCTPITTSQGPFRPASIRNGVRSTASAAARSILPSTAAPIFIAPSMAIAAARRHADARRRRHLHHVRHLGQDGHSIFREHPPVRLGDVRLDLAALRRPDAAVRGDEDQARTVHPSQLAGHIEADYRPGDREKAAQK